MIARSLEIIKMAHVVIGESSQSIERAAVEAAIHVRNTLSTAAIECLIIIAY